MTDQPNNPQPPSTPGEAPPVQPPVQPPAGPPTETPGEAPGGTLPAEPEKPIGAIADPVQSSGLLKTPTPEELAAFPPPLPPVSSDPANVPAGVHAFAPGGVFPLASAEQMQRPQPTFIEDRPPPPRAPKTFAELPEKTQHEVRAGWERSHPGQTFDASTWVEPHIRSAREKLGEVAMGHAATKPVHDRFDGDLKPPPVNEKTRAEMEAGRLAVERRNMDSNKVKAAVAEANASRLAEGDQPRSDDMGYNAGRR